MLFHWLATRRMMAVSGRYTALVNRVRIAPFADSAEPDDSAALVEAVRAATLAEFGAAAVEPAPSREDEPLEAPARAPAQTVPDHIVFLVSLAIGGFVAARLHGRHDLTPLLTGAGFARLAHHSPAAGVALLVLGGALVGFGTRMAGGCTSGHGMCGVSRLQKGSLLATVAFFGTGVVTAFTLGWLS
jgi:uncharacterized membrane protein YedE/YeeE